jgi:hypothetical protein
VDIPCFVVEPTSQYEVYLRRYAVTSTPHCPLNNSYHEAQIFLCRCEQVDLMSYDPSTRQHSTGDYYPHNHSQWPVRCACGYEFKPWDEWQYAPRQVYIRPDTNQRGILKNFPPGALWRMPWLEESGSPYTGADGQSWSVRLPGGNDWMIDARASNCTLPRDDVHKCWCRHGTAPLFTVDKVGNTCAAGAGSIVAGSYHGFLRDGVLIAC